jgi:hypothetical protein
MAECTAPTESIFMRTPPLHVKQLRRALVAVAAVLMCSPNATLSATGLGPPILTQDVELFYRVYDAAAGHPSESQLQRDYIDSGSDGLHQFEAARSARYHRGTGCQGIFGQERLVSGDHAAIGQEHFCRVDPYDAIAT